MQKSKPMKKDISKWLASQNKYIKSSEKLGFFLLGNTPKRKKLKDKISCCTCGAVAPRFKPNLFLTPLSPCPLIV